MGRVRNGLIRYTMWRLAELAAALAVTAIALAALLGGAAPVPAFGSLMVFDFGPSAPLISARLPVTLPLTLLAMVLALAIGLPAAIAGAREPHGMASRTLVGVVRAGQVLPSPWLAMLLIVVVAGVLRWLPPGGFLPWHDSVPGALASLILPAVALALPLAAAIERTAGRVLTDLPRAGEVLGARAAGATERQALLRFGTRAVVAPLLDVLGRQFSVVLAGAMVVETVFYLPGLGRLLFDAVAVQDAALVRSTLFAVIALGALARFFGAIGGGIADRRHSLAAAA